MRIWLALGICFVASAALGQEPLQSKVHQLEWKVNQLQRDVHDAAGPGIALILFGAFCALWAQNTNRNPWLWFFVGFFFSLVAVFVLLYKNADDRKRMS
ncbi:MAG: hypothetical protein WC058_05905 [Phycisphaeraceae bacterium]